MERGGRLGWFGCWCWCWCFEREDLEGVFGVEREFGSVSGSGSAVVSGRICGSSSIVALLSSFRSRVKRCRIFSLLSSSGYHAS